MKDVKIDYVENALHTIVDQYISDKEELENLEVDFGSEKLVMIYKVACNRLTIAFDAFKDFHGAKSIDEYIEKHF